MKLILIFSSDSRQENKQQHLPKCQGAPLIRHLYTIGKQKRVASSSDILILMMMYSWSPSSGHDSSEPDVKLSPSGCHLLQKIPDPHKQTQSAFASPRQAVLLLQARIHTPINEGDPTHWYIGQENWLSSPSEDSGDYLYSAVDWRLIAGWN